MSQTSSTGNLKPSDWERLREAAEKLDQAWRASTELDLATFLPPTNDPLYGAILEELVKTDLEIRRSRGQKVTLDYYLKKYPGLGNEQSLPAKLIYEEYRVLLRFGEAVELENYRQRFPNQFTELQRLVERQPLIAKSETRLHASAPLGMLPTDLLLEEGEILPVGGGFLLVKFIKRGAFGEVWKVEAPGGFPAAMKIIRPSLDGEETQREGRALEVLKRLDHPHLLKIQSSWQLPDGLYILMELAHCNLRERLKAYTKAGATGIPVGELIRYFQEAADALEYLHSQDILHRDVKPENLLLWHNIIKVADFGLLREQKKYQELNTVAGVPLGTPGYMPPEAWRGAHCAASDQYSLALSYAELRLGRWPLPDDTHPAIAHLEHTPDLSCLDKAEREVLLRALAKKPNDRFPTCQAFITALREALPADTREHELPPPSAKPTQQANRVHTHEMDRDSKENKSLRHRSRTLRHSETLNSPVAASSDLFKTINPNESSDVEVRSHKATSLRHHPIPPPNPGKWILLGAIGLLLVVVVAIVVKLIFSRSTTPTTHPTTQTPPTPEKASFELVNSQRERVILSAGSRSNPFPIKIKWENKQRDSIKWEAPKEVAGLTINLTEIDANQELCEVYIAANPNAVPGLRLLEVCARTKEQNFKKPFQVVVLPIGFAPEEPKSPQGSNVLYPPKIFRQIDKQKVVFVLVQPKTEKNKPFYLMENKVSNGVFRAVTLNKPTEGANLSRKQEGAVNGGKEPDDADYPAFGVTRSKAQEFAECLGGKLPEAKQIDLAFGYDDWLKEGRKAAAPVKSTQPGRKKITERGDPSPYGIFGLASNGREWTRDNLTSKDGKSLAVLRGRSYTNPHPVSFAEVDEWRNNSGLCSVQDPNHGSWTTGFRVVIELDNKADAHDR